MRILVAEDEQAMQKILKVYLEKEGYEVEVACDGEEALEKVYEGNFNLLILDWMMPRMSGIEVCEALHKQGIAIKVMMLTAKSETDDEISGLRVGADDYVRKPFDPRVLLLRVRKLLGAQEVLTCGNLTFYVAKGYVEVGDDTVKLSKIEQKLLYYMMHNKDIILSREKLLDQVWGMTYDGDDRTVDTHIGRLRRKIGESMITTYRGMGYSLGEKHE